MERNNEEKHHMTTNFYKSKLAKKLSHQYAQFTTKEFPKKIQTCFNTIFKLITKIKTENKKEYSSINNLFTRKINAKIRKIDLTKNHIISPVDGKIIQKGDINDTELLQAKGLNYSIEELIGPDHAHYFYNGKFITLYLSPKDCHRIFTPYTGLISCCIHHPGYLFPVREPYISKEKSLYCKNERLTTIIESDLGKIAIVKVAAIGVGNITTNYNKTIKTNQQNIKKHQILKQSKPYPLTIKGSHLATFHLGSTVILLFEKNKIELLNSKEPANVHYGEPIAKKLQY